VKTNDTNLPRHAESAVRRPWGTLWRFVAIALATVLISGTSVGAIAIWKIQSQLEAVDLTDADGEIALPAIGELKGGFNVLIVGSDTRDGQAQGKGYGTEKSTLNDVNIVVHISEDHQRATAISIPRDLVVPIPSCPDKDGSGMTGAMSAQPISVALFYGGLPCVALTVSALTGLEINYAGLITFDGVAKMSDAIGGVTVCVDGPIWDDQTGLNIPAAGEYTVQGYDALAFLRSRYGVGDGSDLGRISTQQHYLSSMVRKIQDEGVLLDPGKVYGLAQVAATSMTLSSSLASIDSMVAMALVLKDIPRENINFVQYPSTTGVGGVYAGKVAPLPALAKKLLDAVKADVPFQLDGDATGVGSTLTDGGEAVVEGEVIPGLKGQSAGQVTCAVAN
jgi:LCP family protein required for cell wall assembly